MFFLVWGTKLDSPSKGSREGKSKVLRCSCRGIPHNIGGLVCICGCCSASVMSDGSFSSPTAIWREHWRVDPFPSAEKDGAISSVEVGFITSFLDPLHVLLFHQPGFENTENDT